MVHGVLHTMGYDHEKNEVDAASMEELEGKLLIALGWKVAPPPHPLTLLRLVALPPTPPPPPSLIPPR